MRVEPHPDLVLGDEMRLALHLGVRAEPIVVRARVERDDRESGYVLVFCGQDADARSELERAAPLLPVVEMPDGDGQESGLVVSEILGRAAA